MLGPGNCLTVARSRIHVVEVQAIKGGEGVSDEEVAGCSVAVIIQWSWMNKGSSVARVEGEMGVALCAAQRNRALRIPTLGLPETTLLQMTRASVGMLRAVAHLRSGIASQQRDGVGGARALSVVGHLPPRAVESATLVPAQRPVSAQTQASSSAAGHAEQGCHLRSQSASAGRRPLAAVGARPSAAASCVLLPAAPHFFRSAPMTLGWPGYLGPVDRVSDFSLPLTLLLPLAPPLPLDHAPAAAAPSALPRRPFQGAALSASVSLAGAHT